MRDPGNKVVSTVHPSLINWLFSRGYFCSWDKSCWPLPLWRGWNKTKFLLGRPSLQQFNCNLPDSGIHVTRPNQGLSSLALGGKMRDPGNKVVSTVHPSLINWLFSRGYFCSWDKSCWPLPLWRGWNKTQRMACLAGQQKLAVVEKWMLGRSDCNSFFFLFNLILILVG